MEDAVPTSPQPTLEGSPENLQSRSSNPSSKIPTPLPQRVQELKSPSRVSRADRSHSRGGTHKKTDMRSEPRPKLATRDKSKRDDTTYEQKLKATNDESFRRQVAIFMALRDLPDLRHSVPRLVSSDPSTRSYILRIPSLELSPLDERVSRDRLNSDNLRYLKGKLQLYVKLLYERGVAYKVMPSHIYLASRHGEITLFLGRLRDTGFCKPLKRTKPQWEAQEREQYIKIDHLFVPLASASLGREYESLMKRVEAMKEQSNAWTQELTAVCGEMDATTKEADFQMRSTYTTMEEAYASMADAYAKLQGTTSSLLQVRQLKDAIMCNDMNTGCINDAAKGTKRQLCSLPVVTGVAKPEEQENATVDDRDPPEASNDTIMNNNEG